MGEKCFRAEPQRAQRVINSEFNLLGVYLTKERLGEAVKASTNRAKRRVAAWELRSMPRTMRRVVDSSSATKISVT